DPRRTLILETIEGLPDGVSSDKAYSAIERACSKAEMQFDRESAKDQVLVSRLRKRAGRERHVNRGWKSWVHTQLRNSLNWPHGRHLGLGSWAGIGLSN